MFKANVKPSLFDINEMIYLDSVVYSNHTDSDNSNFASFIDINESISLRIKEIEDLALILIGVFELKVKDNLIEIPFETRYGHDPFHFYKESNIELPFNVLGVSSHSCLSFYKDSDIEIHCFIKYDTLCIITECYKEYEIKSFRAMKDLYYLEPISKNISIKCKLPYHSFIVKCNPLIEKEITREYIESYLRNNILLSKNIYLDTSDTFDIYIPNGIVNAYKKIPKTNLYKLENYLVALDSRANYLLIESNESLLALWRTIGTQFDILKINEEAKSIREISNPYEKVIVANKYTDKYMSCINPEDVDNLLYKNLHEQD